MLPFTYFLALREDWINVNVGKPSEREEENVVHGDIEELVELNTKERFKGHLV